MSNDNERNEKATATTSSTAPRTPEGEADYLQQQAEQARQAIGHTLEDLKASLAQGVDPRLWAKERPWTTVSAAVALGFLAAWGMVPSREEQALKKLKAIERAIGESEEEARHPDRGQAARSESVLGGFGKQLFEAVKPALMAALTSTVHAKVAGNSSDGGHQNEGGPEGPQ